MPTRNSINRKRPLNQSPIELRFIDLFMIIMAALIFIVLSLTSIGVAPTGKGDDSPPEIETSALPTAIQGFPYNLTLAASGGIPPYSWSIAEEELPQGLALDASKGQIAGTPLKGGTAKFAIQITDYSSKTTKKVLTLDVVKPAPSGDALRASSVVVGLPDAITFVPYNFQLEVDGGIPPYSWQLAEGELPNGLSFSPNGMITGELNLLSSDERLRRPCRLVILSTDSAGITETIEAQMNLRYVARQYWFLNFLGAIVSPVFLVLKWFFLSVIAINGVILVLLSVVGFKGGTARRWFGLFRRGAKSRYPA